MEWSIAVPLGSAAISIATLVFTALSLRYKTVHVELLRIQNKLIQVEKDLEDCKNARDELRMVLIELKADVSFQNRRATRLIEEKLQLHEEKKELEKVIDDIQT